ncbi:Wzz/FepE/Etk N-terminal domain-containing protein [Pusillimonas caeni]|uniref:Wzz/FepE/Etk N-terminal domain-containing protein n=1 Tax=Pusillimonas caeni TaxID=1348472 RepID=UPI00143001CC|nr:Wzz/FepE/Etk N-terminal domain-containing protein [Pusillimonas caeni]
MSEKPRPNTRLPLEIDVRDVIVELWRKKWLLFLITAIPLAISCVYVFTRPALYEVSIKVMSVPERALIAYNAAAKSASDATSGILMRASLSEIPRLSPQTALALVIGKLRAYTTNGMRLKHKPSSAEYILNQELEFEGFVQAEIEGDVIPFSIARFTSTQSDQLVQRSNAYLNRIIEQGKLELSLNLQAEIARRLDDMDAYHEIMKGVAIEQARARAIRVREALLMAEELGLENPPLGGPFLLLTEPAVERDTLGTDNLMYLRGAKALRSELARLEKRLEIDSRIYMLPYMIRKMEQLKAIKIEPSEFEIAYIESTSLEPSRRFEITSVLMPIAAGLAGLLSAVLLITFLSTYQRTARYRD